MCLFQGFHPRVDCLRHSIARKNEVFNNIKEFVSQSNQVPPTKKNSILCKIREDALFQISRYRFPTVHSRAPIKKIVLFNFYFIFFS
jgi:hypothetical protein